MYRVSNLHRESLVVFKSNVRVRAKQTTHDGGAPSGPSDEESTDDHPTGDDSNILVATAAVPVTAEIKSSECSNSIIPSGNDADSSQSDKTTDDNNNIVNTDGHASGDDGSSIVVATAVTPFTADIKSNEWADTIPSGTDVDSYSVLTTDDNNNNTVMPVPRVTGENPTTVRAAAPPKRRAPNIPKARQSNHDKTSGNTARATPIASYPDDKNPFDGDTDVDPDMSDTPVEIAEIHHGVTERARPPKMSSIAKYPREKNPFGDDEEDDIAEKVKLYVHTQKGRTSSINRYPKDKNPFDDDECIDSFVVDTESDDDEFMAQRKQTGIFGKLLSLFACGRKTE